MLQERLVCDATEFNVVNGNILKLGAAMRFDLFMRDAVLAWQVPLNKMDSTDNNRTVLDYLNDEIANKATSTYTPFFERYRSMLRSQGALTKGEVQGEIKDRFVDPYLSELRPLLTAYSKACYLSGNRAAVKRGDRWGYVDEVGRVKVPFEYDGAFSFAHERAAVHQRGRWGFVTPDGQIAVAMQYADAHAFRSDGSARVLRDDGVWLRIDSSGRSLP